MVRLVLDRSEHAGMLTQIEGGHFAAGQPTRYLPQSLLLLSRRGCRVGSYDLNDLEPFEFRVRNRERPTGSRIAMGARNASDRVHASKSARDCHSVCEA